MEGRIDRLAQKRLGSVLQERHPTSTNLALTVLVAVDQRNLLPGTSESNSER
jgi:hypothetical protein